MPSAPPIRKPYQHGRVAYQHCRLAAGAHAANRVSAPGDAGAQALGAAGTEAGADVAARLRGRNSASCAVMLCTADVTGQQRNRRPHRDDPSVAIGIARSNAALAIGFVAKRSRRPAVADDRCPSEAIVPRPNGRLLSSAIAEGRPYSRSCLLKGISPDWWLASDRLPARDC